MKIPVSDTHVSIREERKSSQVSFIKVLKEAWREDGKCADGDVWIKLYYTGYPKCPALTP